MIGTIGRALFALGIVLAIALAAPVPKWEANQAALAPVIEKALSAQLPVVVEPVGTSDEKLQKEWHERLKQLLVAGGVTVVERDKVDPATGALALKTALTDTAATAELFAEGAREPVLTAQLARDPKWPRTTTTWALFAIVAAAGVGLWREGVRREAKAGLENPDEQDNPFALLARLLPPARKLGEEIALLKEHEVTVRVDELLDNFVLPLAVVRQKVIDRLGMRAGSEILVVLAYAERMLNRVWSAAADGHLPEAQDCYPDALAALEEANRLAKAALESTYTGGTGTGGPSGAPVAAKDAV